MVALTVLVIIFLVLLAAGLLIFAGFFIVNKIYLNKSIKLMEKFNELSNSVHSINFYKIEILIKNKLPIKVDLDNLKKIYSEISANLLKIYNNLTTVSEEINIMNLKASSNHLKQIKQSLDIAEKDVNYIKGQYDKYTSYGDQIDDIVQTYENIYEELYNFYWTKIQFCNKFKPIIGLFESAKETRIKLNSFKLKYDFKLTNNILIDLRRKLKELAKDIKAVLKFQVISQHLYKKMVLHSAQIESSFREIDTKDLQTLHKKQISFKKLHMEFVKAYWALDLSKAQKYAIAAVDVCKQIDTFLYVHTTTKSLIDASLIEIDKQTVGILSNKNKIKESLDAISRYFIKDQKVTKSLKEVDQAIAELDKLALSAKAIDSTTFSQKLDAIKQISYISKNIYEKKEQIKKTITDVNLILSNVIYVVSELNDLYIYFQQLVVLFKKYLPEDEQTKNIEALINNNLLLLDEYAKTIITVEHPSYANIARGLINMAQSVEQFTKRLKISALLKAYATNLYVYANRYRGSKDTASTYATITKLYKAKEYGKCIELLISLINNIKKQKKTKKTASKN